MILHYVYEKEGNLVSESDELVDFATYNFTKLVEDDVGIFPNVARIPDAKLQKVNPKNLILIEYLKTINLSIKTRKL